MDPWSRYTHSPSSRQPHSYISRILLPNKEENIRRSVGTPSSQKRFPNAASPDWNQAFSPKHGRLGSTPERSRAPTLLNFRPEPSAYNSPVFKPRAKKSVRGSGMLRIAQTAFTEQTVSADYHVERAMRVMESKKRSLDSTHSPVKPDDAFEAERAVNESKRRRIGAQPFTESGVLDVSSIGTTQALSGFQLTSIGQLNRIMDTEPARTNSNGHSNISSVPVAFRRTPTGLNERPARTISSIEPSSSPLSVATHLSRHNSEAAIRRRIPYMSPSELDSLFATKSGMTPKRPAEESNPSFGGELFDTPRASRGFVLNSKDLFPGPSTVDTVVSIPSTAPTLLSESATGGVSTQTSKPSTLRRVGSVVPFIAKLEAHGSRTLGGEGSSSGGIVTRSSTISLSPSDVSSRVARIRGLLSASGSTPASTLSTSFANAEIPRFNSLSATTTFATLPTMTNPTVPSVISATSTSVPLAFSPSTSSASLSKPSLSSLPTVLISNSSSTAAPTPTLAAPSLAINSTFTGFSTFGVPKSTAAVTTCTSSGLQASTTVPFAIPTGTSVSSVITSQIATTPLVASSIQASAPIVTAPSVFPSLLTTGSASVTSSFPSIPSSISTPATTTTVGTTSTSASSASLFKFSSTPSWSSATPAFGKTAVTAAPATTPSTATTLSSSTVFPSTKPSFSFPTLPTAAAAVSSTSSVPSAASLFASPSLSTKSTLATPNAASLFSPATAVVGGNVPVVSATPNLFASPATTKPSLFPSSTTSSALPAPTALFNFNKPVTSTSAIASVTTTTNSAVSSSPFAFGLTSKPSFTATQPSQPSFAFTGGNAVTTTVASSSSSLFSNLTTPSTGGTSSSGFMFGMKPAAAVTGTNPITTSTSSGWFNQLQNSAKATTATTTAPSGFAFSASTAAAPNSSTTGVAPSLTSVATAPVNLFQFSGSTGSSSGFPFNNTPTTTSTTQQQMAQPLSSCLSTPQFNFGQTTAPAATVPAIQPTSVAPNPFQTPAFGSPATAGAFQFGASSAVASPSTGFNFGQSASNTSTLPGFGGIATNTATSSVTGSTGFMFGQSSFGASPATTGVAAPVATAATNMFAFGATNTTGATVNPSSGVAVARRRPAVARRTRRP